MLTSLLFGTDELYEKETIVEKEGRNGKIIKNKLKCIEQKNPEKLNTFQIGHSAGVSKTFLPHFVWDPKTGSVYADIAGLHDTGGDIFNFINSFINKYIFSIAKSIRIILPFTVYQLSNARGFYFK